MNFNGQIGILIAFALYMAVMIGIGIYYSRRQKSLSQYILGDRNLGPWLTSLGAEASDMSGWMLMGLPGYAYLHGLSAFWTASGLILGTWLNWVLTAKRLRTYTEIADNSLTIPDYLSNRFKDKENILRLMCAIFIIIFFIIYTSSGFVAAGKFFNTIFDIPYPTALLLGTFVVVFYTFFGGFGAVALTDFVQGTMMFFTVLYVPIAAAIALGGPAPTMQALAGEGADFFSLLPPSSSNLTNLIMFISCAGWGLGYFGQPHILVRFMAIESPDMIKKSRVIAMGWVTITLAAAIVIGIVGKAFMPNLADGETIYMALINKMFNQVISGVLMTAILAAIMSTASSQLLVAASSVSTDIYATLFKKDLKDPKIVYISRITVVIISVIAIVLALNPESSVFALVAFAWGGFGATFGPMLIFALFWRRTTLAGAGVGMIVGGIADFLWYWLKGGIWDIYEIIPGFILASITIVVVSLLTEPNKEVMAEFDSVKNERF